MPSYKITQEPDGETTVTMTVRVIDLDVPCPHCDGLGFTDEEGTVWCWNNLQAGLFPARFREVE